MREPNPVVARETGKTTKSQDGELDTSPVTWHIDATAGLKDG
eukprot:CAMPEP_0113705008 /NCGR_PEP_ID=MMETSP0038_2-20120614/26876_1 /TAXON_ID=2898 /ORGANISM="Cryptomonas paramecium" /LENGTH=41 /DNA_ID=CAMNT_0000629933 /DNA_START=65 /DNA_END=186 /DNA_ORIENTATION=- /assembly_acc=CAM_ASM_000170